MHNDLKFTQPDSPARSICELIDYIGELSQICSERTFVYRGQINEYSSSIFPDTKFPLLPSKFRPLIDANFLPRNIDNAPLPLGNKYYCVYPVETFGDTVAHRISTGGHRLPLPVKVGIDASHPLVKGILILSDVVFDSERLFDGLRGYAAQHIDFGSDLAITLDNALRETFWQMKEVLADSKYKDSIEDHATPLHEVVDLIHKQAFVYCINDGLYPFPMGQYLAQQYGFRSFYLDVTTKIEVAAFFATHDAPRYFEPEKKGLGTISMPFIPSSE